MGKDKKAPVNKFFKAVIKGDASYLRKYAKSYPVGETDKLGRNGLHLAALHSQERSIRTLLNLGVDPQLSDSQNWTPLHTACSIGHLEIADLIMDAYEERKCLHKKINQSDLIECTPLHLACIGGNCSIVRSLIRKNANIQAKDANGRTPLDICKEKKNEELVETLTETGEETSKKIEQNSKVLSEAVRKDDMVTLVQALMEGANVNSTSEDSQSLLYTATGSGFLDIVKCLIGKGADVNQVNRYNRTILHQCVLERREDMFEYFINLPNIDVTIRDVAGKTIAHTAAEWCRIPMLKELLQKFEQLSLEDKDNSGCTPLHLATKFAKKSMVDYLVNERKVNIESVDNFGKTPLHYAAQWRRLAIMKILLDANATANCIDLEGNTPLHVSIDIKYPAAVQLLLERNADPTIINKKKETPLLQLMKWKRPKTVRMKEGVLIDEKKKEHPLHSRDLNNHTEICRLLTKAMAEKDQKSLNTQDIEGKTALHWAALNHHGDAAVILINEGNADTNIKDKNKESPLKTCDQQLYPRKIRQMLLAAVQAKDQNSSQQTPVNISRKFWKLVKANDVANLKKLLKSKNITIQSQSNKKEQTALHVAASLGLVEMCTFLINELSTIYIHKLDTDGHSALHLAASNDHKDVCDLLIKAGADLGAKDARSKTPRHMASSPDIIALLRDAKRDMMTKELFAALEQGDVERASKSIIEGAGLSSVDEFNCTPLTVACINGLDQIVDLMIENGAEITAIDDNYQTALHWAAMKGNYDCVQKLVNAGIQIDAIDVMGKTALHWAVEKNRQDISVFLVKHHADVNVSDSVGKTPIDYASDTELAESLREYFNRLKSGPRDVEQCNADLFALLDGKDDDLTRAIELLEEGAELEGLDEHQSTPLCVASISGHYEITKEFINRGANVHAEDEGGQTPLHWAAIKGHCSVGQLLIDSKADVNYGDSLGQTPLHWAVLKSHTEFCKLLLRSGADVNLKDYEGQSPFSVARGEIAETIQNYESHSARGDDSLSNVVRSTVREMIHSAIDDSLTTEDQTEEAIMSAVDNILDNVQQKAEIVVGRFVDALADGQ